LFHWSIYVGEVAVKATVLIFLGCAITLSLVGPIDFSISSALPLTLVFLITVTLNFIYAALIGLSAFWTEDISGLFFVLDRGKWLLGGFFMPITLFPE